MTATETDDRLTVLRRQLDTVDDVPVEERVALFDRVNQALVAELDALADV